jgi:hypothetical protein
MNSILDGSEREEGNLGREEGKGRRGEAGAGSPKNFLSREKDTPHLASWVREERRSGGGRSKRSLGTWIRGVRTKGKEEDKIRDREPKKGNTYTQKKHPGCGRVIPRSSIIFTCCNL